MDGERESIGGPSRKRQIVNAKAATRVSKRGGRCFEDKEMASEGAVEGWCRGGAAMERRRWRRTQKMPDARGSVRH